MKDGSSFLRGQREYRADALFQSELRLGALRSLGLLPNPVKQGNRAPAKSGPMIIVKPIDNLAAM
jgi:hypothetical protein